MYSYYPEDRYAFKEWARSNVIGLRAGYNSERSMWQTPISTWAPNWLTDRWYAPYALGEPGYLRKRMVLAHTNQASDSFSYDSEFNSDSLVPMRHRPSGSYSHHSVYIPGYPYKTGRIWALTELLCPRPSCPWRPCRSMRHQVARRGFYDYDW